MTDLSVIEYVKTRIYSPDELNAEQYIALSDQARETRELQLWNHHIVKGYLVNLYWQLIIDKKKLDELIDICRDVEGLEKMAAHVIFSAVDHQIESEPTKLKRIDVIEKSDKQSDVTYLKGAD